MRSPAGVSRAPAGQTPLAPIIPPPAPLVFLGGERDLKSDSPRARQDGDERFRRAIETARQQEARSWELRAAMSLGRLWQGQGKRDAARQLLSQVYGWFAEGFDTADLGASKAMLREVES